MPGIQIDGNNVMEVFQTAQKAINSAREGMGPTLIECLTYRQCGHVGPNDNILGCHTDIRPKEELDYWFKKDPIKGLEELLIKEGIINDSEKKQINEGVEKKIEEAVDFAKKSPWPEEGELLKDVFKL